ncbi:MAG TPA: efflux RND transporter periplasmic adaptor subunit [Bacteroidales bacterium]|nr:HlyD family efflux transporter periplasmic adaptor subunit [Bacteroidales bacterium]HOU95941.1 efflux RND transporter periplasmic adaptor subunit [Bacteroidales bacterium]HQG37425.1 efflux RND transporter periplasmic adaptor subunit [Bacteroidales bacterium]HQG52673.1 efflux RND transporter periplasmic adaptor subunit [Bacteroidales bacterium]HQJ20695.1 efflux RND transporter periplasmic adaptor subunit [Bacteroidales bacterium]
MKKNLITTGIIVISSILVLIAINYISSRKNISYYFTDVQKGKFELTLTITGELEAEKSIDVLAPSIVQQEDQSRQQRQQQTQGNRSGQRGQGFSGGFSSSSMMRMVSGGPNSGGNIRLAPLRITDIVPEGTIIKKGDYIAQLDKSEYDNTLKTYREQLTTYKSQLELRILDSAVMLSGLRDDIKNQIFLIEEAEMKYRNSKYEAPDIIRKAEINLDKAKITLEQKQRSYVLRQAQNLQIITNLQFQISQLEETILYLEELLKEFTITAPADGILVYKRDQTGLKRKVGSMIPPFDRVVATIPDLSVMLSKVYVSEIDIRKIQTGLPVEITMDAFPGKTLKGTITNMANIGETLQNTDTKVYETIIKIEGTDPDIRPSMTTTNKIVIKVIDDAVYIPTECLYSTADSIPFVYTRNKFKQVVIPGESNEKMTIIKHGLKPGASVYTIEPSDPEKFKLAGKDLIPLLKGENITAEL